MKVSECGETDRKTCFPMSAESLLKRISELPPDLQEEVTDFVDFLSTKDKLRQQNENPSGLGSLESDPAIGMWKDREDMRDGAKWVRKLRESEWGVVSEELADASG